MRVGEKETTTINTTPQINFPQSHTKNQNLIQSQRPKNQNPKHHNHFYKFTSSTYHQKPHVSQSTKLQNHQRIYPQLQITEEKKKKKKKIPQIWARRIPRSKYNKKKTPRSRASQLRWLVDSMLKKPQSCLASLLQSFRFGLLGLDTIRNGCLWLWGRFFFLFLQQLKDHICIFWLLPSISYESFGSVSIS